MDSSLLATRLHIPPRTRHLVHRERLVAAIERSVQEEGRKLTLVLAPAGYGKTTLLSQWAHASQRRVAWLSIGEGEHDPERFLRSLLAAWEVVQPEVGGSPVGLLLGSREPDRAAVLAAFIAAASALPERTVFVLDDVHLIEEPAIHDTLVSLLDHLPPTLHFVLAGRAAPPLPLARYRARQELSEIGPEALQFQVGETAALLNGQMQLDLGDEEITALHDGLEGWIAGLQLASLTVRRQREFAAPMVSGRHRFIVDYLSEDVLAHLDEDVRRFLLRTSVLDRLCGALCDAVTEGREGQQMLELLERENLFLVPLDDERAWFRYHRLFADVLREELHRRYPDEVGALHLRAARWHLDRDLPEEAFRHAVAGDDPHLVAQIAARHVLAKLFRGEIRTVQRWMAALPETWYTGQPDLGLARAALCYLTGQFDDCARGLEEVERQALSRGTETRAPLAKVTAMRCYIACHESDLERAEVLGRQALQNLPDEDVVFRPGVFVALGDTNRLHGRWDDARAWYLKSLAFTHAPALRIESVNVYGALADLALRQGRLGDAAAHWSHALTVIEAYDTRGSYALPLIGWVYLRIGELLYERNALEDAGEQITRGLERAELGGDARTLLAGYVLASRCTLTAGDIEAATDYLERARPLLEQAPFPEWTSRFERQQVELWLAQKRPRAAVDWAKMTRRVESTPWPPESEARHLALARVAIVTGDRPALEQALTLLGALLQAADAEGRMGVQIEALALLALARWQGGDRPGALTALEQALRLAEPEGYVRLFADLGLPMARLLQEARTRQIMPDYVATLLAACGGDADQPGALPEPLSEREREVLRLLAAGLSNREIAETLAVSAETVKKHAGSIYGKLGVGNRTEAAARARELLLLDT